MEDKLEPKEVELGVRILTMMGLLKKFDSQLASELENLFLESLSIRAEQFPLSKGEKIAYRDNGEEVPGVIANSRALQDIADYIREAHPELYRILYGRYR